MKIPLALTFVAAFAAGAAEAARPPLFEASGSSPGWQLRVREDGMILAFGPDGVGQGVAGQAYMSGGLRKRPPREYGMLGWESGKIVMEARPGECTNAAGKVLPYRVTVKFEDRTLEGCGSVPAPRKRRR
ncbi:MAG TPA: hypothetical protein VF652_03415 [Allosphingosinicella sp.]